MLFNQAYIEYLVGKAKIFHTSNKFHAYITPFLRNFIYTQTEFYGKCFYGLLIYTYKNSYEKSAFRERWNATSGSVSLPYPFNYI